MAPKDPGCFLEGNLVFAIWNRGMGNHCLTRGTLISPCSKTSAVTNFGSDLGKVTGIDGIHDIVSVVPKLKT